VKPLVLLFAKAPFMGVSKTRLARGIGPVRAWRVKRRLDAHTCHQAACDARWDALLAVGASRDLRQQLPSVWPANLARCGQGRGDLGARMARAFRLHGAHRACLIIGTDCPGLTRQLLARALQALRRTDAVFGPASDGGYWLIGLNPALARRASFDRVRWSSVHALADTLACLPSRTRTAFIDTLSDVDEAADLPQMQLLRRRSRARPAFRP
jgi:uncharacterized protein